MLAYLRRSAAETILVVLNMSGAVQDVAIDLGAVGIPGAKVSALISTTARAASGPLKSIWLDPFSVYIGRISK